MGMCGLSCETIACWALFVWVGVAAREMISLGVLHHGLALLRCVCIEVVLCLP